MSLTEIISFDKDGNPERRQGIKKLFLPLVIVSVAALSFGVGKLTSVSRDEPIKIEYDPTLASQTTSAIRTQGVIASKNGKKYHYIHCPGAKQIKEVNKIIFASPEAAEASGYTLAANCQPR